MSGEEAAEAPLFSIVTPVYDPPVAVLTAMIDSVLAQTFRRWELILVDDCSTDPQVRPVLQRYAAQDDRITVIERATNGHIVAASNDGIDAAKGEFIALVDHDDLLARNALARNAEAIKKEPEVDYLYSDEDHIDLKGRHSNVFRKPDWSPERLRAQNYCNHFSVLRTSLVREVGRFREGFDGSQDHDLVLRVTEKAREIVHIPEVLYHWRAVEGSAAADIEAKPYAFEAGRKAVQEHLDRVGVVGTVEIGGPGRYDVVRPLPPERRVSIVIPTIGSRAQVWGERRIMVLEAVRTALALTDHPNIEVVVVVDDPTPDEVIGGLRELAGDKLVLVRFHEKFNYSRKINMGVLASTGDRIVILNDDTEVRSERWLEELVSPLEEETVGMTGALLYYSSDTIQHAGLAMSRGHYMHPYKGFPDGHPGPFGALMVTREVSGVTGACVGIRRDTYLEVGGLSELLPENFNDVDFSYKVTAAGYRTLVVHRCKLFHFETMTRTSKVQQHEYDFVKARWGRPGRDPYIPEFPDMPETLAEKQEVRRRHVARRIAAGLH